MVYDAVIVGAGPAGLAAAARLAHFGRRVCVLERQRRAGGLNTFYHRGGRWFDAGLHALTNWPASGAARSPWRFLMRQLRMRTEEFDPQPQTMSEVIFPGASLQFTNDPRFLEDQIAKRFPQRVDAYRRFVADLPDYGALPAYGSGTARAALEAALSDPRLINLLLWPVLCYGAATEDDMDYGMFVALFRSIFLEGLWRPRGGIRPLLEALTRRIEEGGGELRLGTAVREIRPAGRDVDGGGQSRRTRVILDDDGVIETDSVLSSAGYRETMRLCGAREAADRIPVGAISFFESVLFEVEGDCGSPGSEEEKRSVIFFHGPPEFGFRKPAGGVDFERGVVCCSEAFGDRDAVSPACPTIRITHLANHDFWAELSAGEYKARKREAFDRSIATAARHAPRLRARLSAGDTFTPRTIERYTAHAGGAVYGSPLKRPNGATAFPDVVLIGADQGGVGVVGALLSGVVMANQCLQRAS